MTSEGAVAVSSSEAAARLCTSCGTCCTDSFYSWVDIKPGEDVAKIGTLLPLVQREGRMSFRLPCTKQQGACCTIYAERPETCRGYRCKILREVQETPAKLPTALEKVAQLLALVDQLKKHLIEAGYLTPTLELNSAIMAFRKAYAAALATQDTSFFTHHKEMILRWKKTAWVMSAFDAEAANRLILPSSASVLPTASAKQG